MNNRQGAQETRNVTVCAFLEVPANAAVFAGNVAFSTIATKMIEDSAAAVIAGTNAAADNTGYSVDKIIGKEVASQMASQLCASCIVKLDILGNNALSNSLNSSATFYNYAKDAVCTNRLMSVYNVMNDNLELITPAYVTAAELAIFLTKINKYTTTKGSSSLVNNNSPVLTQTYNTAMKLTNTDVATIKELAKFYKTTHPLFYSGIMKACKMPAVPVRHTPLVITVIDASTTGVLPDVKGTLTKSKEQPMSNVAGIMTYATVLAGGTTGTFAKAGYITSIKALDILRGKTNAYTIALVPGIMTAEQEQAIKDTIARVIADDMALIAAKKKAKKDAKAATVAANALLAQPIVEAVAVEPVVETGDAPTA